MAHYYHLDSSGEDTNLQLYSLRQAKRYWSEIQQDYQKWGEDTENLKERCVFTLATLGLSISQLLGQNNPTLQKKVPYPINIFRDFVATHCLDAALPSEFKNFNYFYNGCRHFGKTTDGEGYERIDQLTFAVAKECYEFGLKVWRTVIGVYRNEDGSDLEEFDVDELPDKP